MDCKKNRRNIFQRLFGLCITKLPDNPHCWKVVENKLQIDLQKAPELSKPGSALRFENENRKILVVHFENDTYAAYNNECLHAKRRLDPVPGTETVQCCSVGTATYDKSGKVLCGEVEGNLKTFDVTLTDEKLEVHLI
ncbi:MAG: hypothetical protein SCALA702_03700 [Melioribacteraceae bacterium]|nr:MAG: hypothetical protein SCALA702_03700 [Melioribacteraceae bacterium]